MVMVVVVVTARAARDQCQRVRTHHTHTPPTPTQPITKDELAAIAGPASMHAIGHVAANLSFAAVAISLTHTVKTLEPAFNVVLSQVGWWG